MLVLSRKKNEKVVISHGITVEVVEIRGDKVRLGFIAPREIEIHRQEIQDRIDKQEDSHGQDNDAPKQPDHSGTNAAHGSLS